MPPRSEMLRRASNDASISGGEGSMLGHLLRVDRGDRSLVAVSASSPFPTRSWRVFSAAKESLFSSLPEEKKQDVKMDFGQDAKREPTTAS